MALGQSRRVLNVGAGTGSYEPMDRLVIAVEPSVAMIRQRTPSAAQAVRASAGRLPFRDSSFDAALGVLTVHHWPNPSEGLDEMMRVARERVVVLTWDPQHSGFWLVREYFPEIAEIDRAIFPRLDELERALGPVDIQVVIGVGPPSIWMRVLAQLCQPSPSLIIGLGLRAYAVILKMEPG